MIYAVSLSVVELCSTLYWCVKIIRCEQMALTKETSGMSAKVSNLQKAIRGGYRHNWIIDNLPAASLEVEEVLFVCGCRYCGPCVFVC